MPRLLGDRLQCETACAVPAAQAPPLTLCITREAGGPQAQRQQRQPCLKRASAPAGEEHITPQAQPQPLRRAPPPQPQQEPQPLRRAPPPQPQQEPLSRQPPPAQQEQEQESLGCTPLPHQQEPLQIQGGRCKGEDGWLRRAAQQVAPAWRRAAAQPQRWGCQGCQPQPVATRPSPPQQEARSQREPPPSAPPGGAAA